jgi:hypothetical protein
MSLHGEQGPFLGFPLIAFQSGDFELNQTSDELQIPLGQAPGVSGDLFAKPVDDFDQRCPGRESRAQLEYRADLFAQDEMGFALGIIASAGKLRDPEPNDSLDSSISDNTPNQGEKIVSNFID